MNSDYTDQAPGGAFVIAWLSNNWFFLTLLFGAGCLIVRIDRRLQKLGKDIERQERKRIEGQERNALILQGLDATLDALHSAGFNGKVTAARNSFELYTQKQAAR